MQQMQNGEVESIENNGRFK